MTQAPSSFFNLSRPKGHNQAHVSSNVKEIELFLEKPFNKRYTIKVNLNYRLADLRLRVKSFIDKLGYPPEFDLEEFEFRYDGSVVPPEAKISEVLIVPVLNRISVCFFSEKTTETLTKKPRKLDPSLLPKMISTCFRISPTLEELSLM